MLIKSFNYFSLSGAIKLDPFSYTCDEYSRCVRGPPVKAGTDDAMSLTECKFTCLKNALLWPYPKELKVGKGLASFHPDNVGFGNKDYYGFDVPAVEWLEEAITEQVRLKFLSFKA